MVIQLQNITSNDNKDIKIISQNKNVMRFIGNGEIWNDEKVNNFIKYNELEKNLPDKKRDNYYYKIVDENKFIGIIGFHKFFALRNNNFYLTIFINPQSQGSGVFSQSIKLLKKKIQKHKPYIKKLFSLVRDTNVKMNEISANKFIFNKSVLLKKDKLNEYIIYLDIPKENNTFKKKFYLVKDNYFNSNMIHQVFKNINKNNDCFWEEFNLKKPQNKIVDFMFVDSAHWSKPYITRLKSEYRSILDDNKNRIVKKDNLFQTIGNEKFVLKQYNFDLFKVNTNEFKNIFKNKKWILKPVEGYAGLMIDIFDNYDDLLNTINQNQNKLQRGGNKRSKKNKNKNKSKKRFNKYSNWVLQEYIDNPLLFKKRKFHIRCYLVYTSNNTCYLLKIARILCAKNDYIKDDYKNKEIHDTHFGSTDKPYYLERDIKKEYGVENYHVIFKQMVELFKKVFKTMDIGCYNDTQKCYEIFGADLMVTDNFDVKLIEINNKLGFNKFPDDKVDLHKIVFSSLVDIVLQRFELDNYVQVKGFKNKITNLKK